MSATTEPRFRTFTRTMKNWGMMTKARKHVVDRGLTFDEAYRACSRFNAERTPAEKRRGLKMEFEQETK